MAFFHWATMCLNGCECEIRFVERWLIKWLRKLLFCSEVGIWRLVLLILRIFLLSKNWPKCSEESKWVSSFISDLRLNPRRKNSNFFQKIRNFRISTQRLFSYEIIFLKFCCKIYLAYWIWLLRREKLSINQSLKEFGC